jgi:hypothetical protein
MSNGRAKNPHDSGQRGGHNDSAQERKVDGKIHVNGSVEINLSDDLKTDRNTEREDDNTHRHKELYWARLTFLAVVTYTTIAAVQTCVNNKAAKAAKDAGDLARQSLQISQRAYITIGRKDGVIADFVIPKDPNQDAEIVLFFQNTGRIPAKLAWGTFGDHGLLVQGSVGHSGITYTHGFKGLPIPSRDKSGKITGWVGGEAAVVAGDSVFVSTLGKISQKDIQDLSHRPLGSFILGIYEYCDGLGNHFQHNFALGFRSNAPISSMAFSLITDTEAASPPLNPCEQSIENPNGNTDKQSP